MSIGVYYTKIVDTLEEKVDDQVILITFLEKKLIFFIALLSISICFIIFLFIWYFIKHILLKGEKLPKKKWQDELITYALSILSGIFIANILIQLMEM
jgi:hypothetical protein